MGYSNLSDMAPRWSKSKKEFIITDVKTFCIENSRRKKYVVKRDKNLTLTGKVSYMIRNTSHTLLNGPTSRICNMILFFCWYKSLFIKFKSYSLKTFFTHIDIRWLLMEHLSISQNKCFVRNFICQRWKYTALTHC